MGALAILSVAAALVAAPQATAPSPAPGRRAGIDAELRRAKNEYAYGNYDNAVKVLTGLLYDPEHGMRLYDDADIIDARKYLGLTYFLLDKKTDMQEEFLKLLYLEPDYQLDPFTTAPAVVDEFERLRRAHQVELDVIRQRKSELKLEVQGPPGARRIIEQRVIERSDVLSFFPLGLGQFQNGDTAWGIFFLATELALLAVNIGSYLWAQQVPNGADDALVRGLTISQYASLAAFGITYSLGVLQARANFVPTVMPPPAVRDEPIARRFGGALRLSFAW